MVHHHYPRSDANTIQDSQYDLDQGFPNFSDRDPQNNGARDWQPPTTLEQLYNVAPNHAHALLGLCKIGINTTQKNNSLTEMKLDKMSVFVCALLYA